jgi:hypothetical protein
MGKPEGKRPLGRLRHTREDTFKMDLNGMDWYLVVWTGLMYLRIGTSRRLL